ncbi:MAG: LuxR family transcriptional regulator [Comamonadaceae bacterium]|nr:MAG: LuxR family transcriptional regulator [Comamonadaceae bacterium]
MTATLSDIAHPYLNEWLSNIGQQGPDPVATFGQIERVARELGFEHCAYGLRLPLSFTARRFMLMSTYDDAWRQRYHDANYVAIDPTVLHGTRSLLPLVWSNDLFIDAPELWAEARSFGLRVGWAQSCFDAEGHIGMLTVARSHDAFTAAELRVIDPILRVLANVSHAAMAPAMAGRKRPNLKPLTPREREVLKWTADGKTSEQVAEILEISANTVNFHMKSVLEKLQVANRTAAATCAAVLGLLD